MAVSKYYRAILDTLQGKTDELGSIPPERRDWAGPGALLESYHNTSGKSRTEMIRAIGQVIRNHPASAGEIAQLVNMACALDLAEVEPQVRELNQDPVAAEEPLKSAIRNYLTFRELPVTLPSEGSSSTANGRPGARKGSMHRTENSRSPRMSFDLAREAQQPAAR